MTLFKLLSTTALVSASLVGSASAVAQVSGPPEVVVPNDATEPTETPDGDDAAIRNADGSDADEGETITVTGTRIRLPNLRSLEPTVTVDFRQIRERNFTNVADALNELPGFRGSVTPAGEQGTFGQGVNFVNTYGLGSNRTLTLINGRRFVSSNPATNFGNAASGTQVDLNVIPTILLDRIDVVSIGGAPIYGSDAIAGVVNNILRSKYDGIEATGLVGITEEGDNFRYNVSALLGGNLFGDRLNLTFAASRDIVTGLILNERDFLRRNIGNLTNPNAAQAASGRPAGFNTANDGRLNPNIGLNLSTTDLQPGTVLSRQVGIPFLTSGGLITGTNLTNTDPRNPASILGVPNTNVLQFDNSGNLIPFNQGTLFVGNNASGVGNGASGDFLFNNFGQITSDLKRDIYNGFITFEVTDDIDIFFEGTHFRSRADELVQQPTFSAGLFGRGSASGQLRFSVNTPFLTPQARAALVARGVTTFDVSRANTDLSDNTGFAETRINRGVGGIRGDFQMFGRDFNFEAYGNYGRVKSSDFGQAISQQRFVNAVNVTVNAAGQIVCNANVTAATNAAAGSTLPVADPNCVPFNPLGFGVASQAARDYLIVNTEARSVQRQIVYNANVGGSLFDLPGGPVGVNVGYEHRDEKASFSPDQFLVTGQGRSVPITGLAGRYNVDEAFGEVLVPLVSPDMGLSFLQDARIFARGRYVDNTVNGGFFAFAVGGTFAPVRGLEFRGNFTRSFRSPSVTELFLPRVNAFSAVPDICSEGSRNSGPGAAQPIRAANCAAFLARFPNATPDTAAGATVPIQTGGDPNLDNEQADSYTFGLILQPRFLPRFSLTADYISITLNDPIASLTAAGVAAACFDNTEFNAADPANGNAFCSRIRRSPAGTTRTEANGSVTDIGGRVVVDPVNPAVNVGFVNGVEIKFRGIQGTANYSFPLSGLGIPGDVGIGADGLYVRKRLNNITGVNPLRSDGGLGDPEFSGQLRLRYTNKSFGMNTTINYTGEQLFSRFNRAVGVAGSGPDAREIDELDDYITVNTGIFFDATEDFRLTLSVNNVFNRQGQKYFGELIPASFNDLLGRRFAASARINF